MENELNYYKHAYVTAIGSIKMLKAYIREKAPDSVMERTSEDIISFEMTESLKNLIINGFKKNEE